MIQKIDWILPVIIRGDRPRGGIQEREGSRIPYAPFAPGRPVAGTVRIQRHGKCNYVVLKFTSCVK